MASRVYNIHAMTLVVTPDYKSIENSNPSGRASLEPRGLIDRIYVGEY